MSATVVTDCQDTAGWATGYNYTCSGYVRKKWCASGTVVPGQEWTLGKEYRHPEDNCCVCGKNAKYASKGKVDVYVDQGEGFKVSATKGMASTPGATILDACYDNIEAVRMQNEANSMWKGSVTFARDKAGSYTAGFCTTCTRTGMTSSLLVDGDANLANDEALPTSCLNGEMCDITAPAAWTATPGTFWGGYACCPPAHKHCAMQRPTLATCLSAGGRSLSTSTTTAALAVFTGLRRDCHRCEPRRPHRADDRGRRLLRLGSRGIP